MIIRASTEFGGQDEARGQGFAEYPVFLLAHQGRFGVVEELYESFAERELFQPVGKVVPLRLG